MSVFESAMIIAVVVIVFFAVAAICWMFYTELKTLEKTAEIQQLEMNTLRARADSLESTVAMQRDQITILEASSKLKDQEIERLRNRLARRDEDVASLSTQLLDLRAKYDALIESNRRDRSGF